MPDFARFRRPSAVAVAVAMLMMAGTGIASASQAFADATASPTAPTTSSPFWGIPVGMTLWGLIGLVGVVAGLFVAAKPTRRLKAAGQPDPPASTNSVRLQSTDPFPHS
ncbi:hypothetical protein SAMN04515671_0532 [Nakamurella panacisegetis]|uniref:Uncharacterized protein n=1 Tax=Nakamurella panacisegetis TaxID=1090615 RepID=A0A1H0IJM3_9ACTN|nr:hypothetical protein [Nakamurella panacisegetis]SDO31536.1 hypothetical protein SAMN04515671_0532 [Nakamurella panacisegetis]